MVNWIFKLYSHELQLKELIMFAFYELFRQTDGSHQKYGVYWPTHTFSQVYYKTVVIFLIEFCAIWRCWFVIYLKELTWYCEIVEVDRRFTGT
jgi:hypothetical protein